MTENTDHHSELFKSRYAELSPKFLDYHSARSSFKKLVPKDESIVEIGIGSGSFAIPLIQEGYMILSDCTFCYGTTEEGYDTDQHKVTKWFRFIEKDGTVIPGIGKGLYTRFSTPLSQLREIIYPLSIEVDEGGIWTVIQNSSS